MEHVNTKPPPGLAADAPIVTGRKAARSLRLFRGDGRLLGAGGDVDDADTAADAPHAEPDHAGPNAAPEPQPDVLEPVSSATYYPHTPLKDAGLDEELPDAPSDTESLQHLMADLEFDRGSHGDITKIKMHAPDTEKPPPVPEAFAAKYPLTVELRPFKNKVGGHTAIFKFSKRAVCKALMNRENLWYEAVEKKHLDLLKFMPKYIGVLNVRYSSIINEEATPVIGPVSLPLDEDLDPLPAKKHRGKKTRFRRPSFPLYDKLRGRISDDDPPPEVLLDDNRHMIPDLLWRQLSNSAPNSTLSDDLALLPELCVSKSPDAHFEKMDLSVGSTSVNTDLQAQVIQEVFDPHSIRSEDIFQMDEGDCISTSVALPSLDAQDSIHSPVLRKHTRFERFILLEDLTANMLRPCALDLKMGSRQYGVEASDAKQASQRKKCSLTTSRELGVRVCGLQVWNQSTNSYYMRDKYFGRKLKKGPPFARVLAKFLYDGSSALSIVRKIPSLVEQLRDLYLSFHELKGYRMYGLSILLMYDGAAPLSEAQVKVHIIDFAQSVIAEDADSSTYRKPPRHPDLPDMGYLRGLRSLILYFKAIFEIITKVSFDEVEDVAAFIEQNAEQLDRECYWIGRYDEAEDDSVLNEAGPEEDPFEVRYDSLNDNESCISD